MTDPHYEVHAITFEPDGLVLHYMHIPDDIRVEGALMQQHQLRMNAAHPDYADDTDALQHRALKILRNALQDFHESDPYIPDEEDDEEEDRGMGE